MCPSLTQLHLLVALQCFLLNVLDGDVASCNVYNLQNCCRHGKQVQSLPRKRLHPLKKMSFPLFSLLLFYCLLFSSSFPPGPHGFQERLAASQEAMKNKNVVNLGAIRQGMKRFQFLLNCCEPGTIPDASILAAALDLVCFRIKINSVK